MSDQGTVPLTSADNDVLYEVMPYDRPCANASTPNPTMDVERQTIGLSRGSSTDDKVVGDGQSTDDEEDQESHSSQTQIPGEHPGLPQNPGLSNRSANAEELFPSGTCRSLAVKYFLGLENSDSPADKQDDHSDANTPMLIKRTPLSNEAPKPISTNCMIPVRGIYKYFAEHCPNPNNACFLTQLYSAIGSQEAFVQLKNAAQHLRSNKVKIPYARANSVLGNMRSLDQLASTFAASTIMERYLLVQLVDQRDALVEKHKPQRSRRLRMVTENRSRLPRAEGLALESMMDDSYPLLDRGTEDYEAGLTTLKNRLSKGRNLRNLKEKFGRYILALIPVDGSWQIHDRE
ncbi:hypothetical protein BJX70DRAFT_401430 [Aspergillus crustosus]